MQVPIFQVDAFTNRLFAGNPAAVIPMDDFPPDAVLQAVAAENNLSETAFFVPRGDRFDLRWFTPTVEVPLCGHATLASAAVIMERLRCDLSLVTFDTASGPLMVERSGSGYSMDLPAHRIDPLEPVPQLEEVIGMKVDTLVTYAGNYLALLPHPGAVRNLDPDPAGILALGCTGLVVTSPSDGPYDFVSRYFAPGKGIDEDPVTGGAHCALTPFWAARTRKQEFFAYQASARGGEIRCRLVGDRVQLIGDVAFYLEGKVTIDDNA
jgi:PhzF family phenazine biosynthesis protein